MSSWVHLLWLLAQRLTIKLFMVSRATNKAQRPTTLGSRIIFVSVKRSDSFSHMMTRIGYRELTGVSTSSSETAAEIGGRTGRGLYTHVLALAREHIRCVDQSKGRGEALERRSLD